MPDSINRLFNREVFLKAVFPAFMLFLGAITYKCYAVQIKEAKKAAQWPYVEGIITRSKTIETVKKEYNVDLGGNIQRNKDIVNADYCADIEYKYVAGNAALLSKLDMGLRCSKSVLT